VIMADEPKDNWVDTRTTIGSHTDTEFGHYDDGPFLIECNTYGWYLRATYWKRQYKRNEGIQKVIDFDRPDRLYMGFQIPVGMDVPYGVDLQELVNILKPTMPNMFSNKINGIKYVRGK